MVEVGKEKWGFSIIQKRTNEFVVCKLLSFIRLDLNGIWKFFHPRKTSPTCYAKNFNNLSIRKWCFVQFYDVVDEMVLTLDAVDYTLDCIRSQWAGFAGIYGNLKSRRGNGLIPGDAMKGKLHIIRFEVVNGVLLPSDHRHEELVGLAKTKQLLDLRFLLYEQMLCRLK